MKARPDKGFSLRIVSNRNSAEYVATVRRLRTAKVQADRLAADTGKRVTVSESGRVVYQSNP